jgi:Glycosyl transferase family 2
MSEQPLVLEPGDSPDHPMAAWFDDIRQTRRRHYESRPRPEPGARTRALITMVHNEPVFLPIWLGYYSRFFVPEDIYVFDNESDDGSTERDGFVRLPVRHNRVDHRWMVRKIQDLQHELLDRYDMVLVTDVDEIVAPDPRWGTLGEYLDRFDEEWVNCLGYELLHVRDKEPPLRLEEPILSQRHHWYFNDAYNKAALASAPMDWTPGFHGRTDGSYALDPDLRMIHLHRMDYELCLERHRTRSRRRWARRDARLGWAGHNRIVDDRAFERWFYEDAYFERFAVKPEQIPERWRSVF